MCYNTSVLISVVSIQGGEMLAFAVGYCCGLVLGLPVCVFVAWIEGGFEPDVESDLDWRPGSGRAR